jgi:hypothetical protein
MSQLIVLSVGICVALLVLALALAWWKKRHGAADGVRQLLALDHDRFLSIEYQLHTGADDGALTEARWSVRSLTDGRLLTRADFDDLRIVARGRRHLVAVGARPRVCVLDTTPALVAGEAEIKASTPALDDFAAPEALAPEVHDGRLSVFTARGQRVPLTLAAVDGALETVPDRLPVFDERAERRVGMRLDGGPRRQLKLRGKAVAGVDFLHGAFLVEPEAAAVLVAHDGSLDGEGGLISALGDDGQPRWTTTLERSLTRDAGAALVAGDKLVFALSARSPRPLEIVCVDLRSGAILWRLRP